MLFDCFRTECCFFFFWEKLCPHINFVRTSLCPHFTLAALWPHFRRTLSALCPHFVRTFTLSALFFCPHFSFVRTFTSSALLLRPHFYFVRTFTLSALSVLICINFTIGMRVLLECFRIECCTRFFWDNFVRILTFPYSL